MILQNNLIDGIANLKLDKSKKKHESAIVKLCFEMMADICTLGESAKVYQEDVEFLSEAIVGEYKSEKYFRCVLRKTLIAVVLEQPHKQFAIAMLILHVYSKDSTIGESLVDCLFDRLQQSWDYIANENIDLNVPKTGVWNEIKLLTRLFALLSPIIDKLFLKSTFQSILNLAFQLQNINSTTKHSVSQQLIYNVMINLPYVFYYTKYDSDWDLVIDGLITSIKDQPVIDSKLIDLLSWYNETPLNKPIDVNSSLLKHIDDLRRNCMKDLKDLFLNHNYMLPKDVTDIKYHKKLITPNIEQVQLFISSKTHKAAIDSKWRFQKCYRPQILPSTSTQFSVISSYESYSTHAIGDVIVDIVTSMDFNRKEVAKQVLMLNQFYSPNLFVPRHATVTKSLQELNKTTLNSFNIIEEVAINTILESMFGLPEVSLSFAYYHILLVEIFAKSPTSIAPIFGNAIRKLYSNIGAFDFELRMRFLNWFVVQLSNFEFSWKWNEWENDSKKLQQHFYNPKMVFIKNLIKKETRQTSNVSDVEDSLPTEFRQYLNTSYFHSSITLQFYQSLFNETHINLNDITDEKFFFIQSSVPFNKVTLKIIDYFHQRDCETNVKDLQTIFQTLKINHSKMFKNYEKAVVVILIQTLMHVGNRSLSHANKYISDFADDVKLILSKLHLKKSQIDDIVVEAAIQYWNSNSQTGFIIVNALKHMGLTTTRSVIKFCLLSNSDKIIGVTDYSAMDALFNNLSQDVSTKSNWEQDFVFLFESLCTIIQDCNTKCEKLNLDVSVCSSFENKEVTNYDSLWKYQLILSLMKCVLRKYNKVINNMINPLQEICNTRITNDPTRSKISSWLQETKLF